MAPSIAFDELPAARSPLRVLDPMVGSGTTAVVARAKGHSAIGYDTDPLAMVLSSAWSSNVNPKAIGELAAEVLKEAESRHRLMTHAHPTGADEATKEFVNYWFDRANRLQLRALAEAIERVPSHQKRNVLWCGFSRLIIAKSRGVSLAMDLSHSRPHKVYKTAPVEPFTEFLGAVKRVAKNIPFNGKVFATLPTATIHQHDARKLPLADSTIDLVITSPPYLNAIDYVRCSKFTLVWMGYSVGELQKLRSENIGSERALARDRDADFTDLLRDIGADSLVRRDTGMLRRYAYDLDAVLTEIVRVLVPQGRAIFVVGDSTLHGTFIKNSEIIRRLASMHDLKLTKRFSRELLPSRRYLPPPGGRKTVASLRDRMRQEVIMHFVSEKAPGGRRSHPN
jgi:SAM-dependent methyltransferase